MWECRGLLLNKGGLAFMATLPVELLDTGVKTGYECCEVFLEITDNSE